MLEETLVAELDGEALLDEEEIWLDEDKVECAELDDEVWLEEETCYDCEISMTKLVLFILLDSKERSVFCYY